MHFSSKWQSFHYIAIFIWKDCKTTGAMKRHNKRVCANCDTGQKSGQARLILIFVTFIA